MVAAKKAEPKFGSIKPIKKLDIPIVEKAGIIRRLEEFQDFIKVAQYVAEHGTAPYEAFDLIDFAEVKKKDPKVAKMKLAVTSFITAARKVLKQYQVEKKLQLVVRKERIFLESLE